MVDIHSHILPNVDDGSSAVAQSLDMLKEEVSQGVDTVVLTPHHRFGYNKTPSQLQDEFFKFKETVDNEKIPVKLFLGQEVFVTKDIKKLIREKSVMGIGGTEYMLVEFDFVRKCEIAETMHELKCEGIKPILAHPERYAYFTLDDAYEVKCVGGLIQVNAPSMVGAHRWGYLRFIKSMFKEGFVDFVASDLHFNRPNCMAEAYALVKKKFGADAAEVTFNLNAKRILKG